MRGGRAGVVLLLLGALASAPGRAQQQPATPFETIGLTLSVVDNVNRNRFHDYWSPNVGAELAAETPFYLGHIELGIEQVGFDARRPDVPGYRARYVFIGWGADVAPAAALRWRFGARLGNYGMRFDDESLPAYRRGESELGTDLATRLAWRVAPAWQLSVSGRYRVVLTEPRIRHAYLAAGVTRTFDSPRWLRDFLD